MPVHPEFAELILAGEKRVEFRRRSFAKKVTHIVVYATSPVRAVVGVVEVIGVRRGSPNKLWSAFAGVGGITRSKFDEYFRGAADGVAYELGRVWLCNNRVPLGRSGLPGRPPQTFQYIPPATVTALKQKARRPVPVRRQVRLHA